MSTLRRIALGLTCALSIAAWPRTGAADSRVAVGDVVQSAEMKTLDGKSAPLLSRKARVNVIVFFRPGQAYSLETLQGIASCTQEFASKPVHFAAVVSSSWTAEEVKETVVEAGVHMPVLIDRGDELYGRLGVQVHPAVVVLDDKQRVVAHEPFRRVNYCDRVRGKIQYALHEIDLVEMKRTEDPNFTAAADRPGSDPFVSARRFLVGSGEFEEAVPTVKAILEKEREVAPAHALLDDVPAAEATGEWSPR